MPAHSLLFSKSTKGAARLNVPIRRTVLHAICTAEGSNLSIRKCTCPPRRGSNPGPAEPEADTLPSEPARRAVVCNVKPTYKPNVLYVLENSLL